jgi:hypothetical protein
VDINGIPVLIEGTIDDVVNKGQSIFDDTKNWINGVFNTNGNQNQNPEVVKNEDGSIVYEDEDGQVFTQRLVDRKRFIVRPQYEVTIAPWTRFTEVSLRLGTGKYHYLSASGEAEAQIFPMVIFSEAKKLLRGIRYKRDAFLNTVFVSANIGWDSGYPGWVFVNKKSYKGIGLGISAPIFEGKALVVAGYTMQTTKAEYKDKKQSFGYLNLKVPIN